MMTLMDEDGPVIERAIAALRAAGARFCYLHGSRATGRARQRSDVDLAALFGRSDLVASDVLLEPGVDLLVLDTAPLELAGRVAASGTLLFEQDASERVAWEATTRKIYFDERPRFERAHRDFLESVRRG
ncbi:nucleotidyltransferase domain-containing protein [Ruania suaedae]|uniref:type VII toxin-antitoxin system MntA family adenylyltransferase antitoxin n=1 Tax=Ruania suaedae TaxID=2897774 RepID=UPI001E394F14|nr:nucleotidyltransferase domain-containing protein [Ruania suaedae]UFU02939.1 nucleotidyltransferase domain-containing protein [Ruania suaedae]